jgi:site-specific recombinase XerD
MSLADLHDQLPALLDKPKRHISDVRSALNLLSKVLQRPLAELPADPEPLGKLLSAAPWQPYANKQRWANAKSLINSVLFEVGVISLRSRQSVCLSAEWRALLGTTKIYDFHCRLSRFARWCSSKGIPPDKVTPETFRDYENALRHGTPFKKPREQMHVARRAWNKAAKQLQGWPQVYVPSPEDSRCYALPWGQFPERLQREVSDYLKGRSTPSLLDDDHRAIKPRTVHQHVELLRRFASLLVKDGIDPQQLICLAKLLDPVMAKRGLGLLLRENRTTPKAEATANTLCSIARYLDLPNEQVAELKKFARKLRTRPTGMALKNKQRLAPLKDPAIKRKLVQLPLKIAREMEKIDKPTHNQAVRMRFALAVGILQFAPMRVSNLASLDRERHIGQLKLGTGPIHISIPADEVKNSQPLYYQLPEPVANLVALYWNRFRPLLLDASSTALFPSSDGKPMVSAALARSIREGIARELGLKINAHLFRHISALLYLCHHPGDYETVRRLLGHKSVATTIACYAPDVEMEQSVHLFDQVVLKLVEGVA